MLYINVLLNLPSVDERLMDLEFAIFFSGKIEICCFYGMNVKELILCTLYTNIFPGKKNENPGELVSQTLVLLILLWPKVHAKGQQMRFCNLFLVVLIAS